MNPDDYLKKPEDDLSKNIQGHEEGCSSGIDQYPFVVLSTDQIVQDMFNSANEVNTVLNIDPTTVRILLNHFKWDKEKLLNRYYAEDQEAMFREAHIISPFSSKLPIAQTKNVVCEICYCEKLMSIMHGLDCDHLYCSDCWTEYLKNKIVEDGASQMIKCPGGNCNIIVDDETVMSIITDPQVLLKYQQLITNSFVSCNRLLRWCPSAHCNNAVKVQHVDSKPVKCLCGNIFCFTCSEDWHDPVSCDLLKKWIKKCNDDSETTNWIATHTKACPECSAPIEKNGGCNHIICENPNCEAEFCWMCLGFWARHITCNRFDDSDSKAIQDAKEKSELALQRYLFYYDRYKNHRQSLTFENKLDDKVKAKMVELQEENHIGWIDVQFLPKSLDTLCECRRALMYTYSFAYYLQKNNQSEIFEENQKDLEAATEQLSGYLEREISGENLVDMKQEVQDKYRYCDSRRRVLLGHVLEGHEKDWWNFNEADSD